MDNPFIGSWKLISFILEAEDGETMTPFGEDPVGYIMYGTDERMQVAIMRNGRQALETARYQDGPTNLKAAAFEGYISYAGPYTIGDDTITHHLEVAWWPDMVGMDNVRKFKFDGNRLRLSVPPTEIKGKVRTGHLTWEQAEAIEN